MSPVYNKRKVPKKMFKKISTRSTNIVLPKKSIEYKQFTLGAGYLGFSTNTFAVTHLTPVTSGNSDSQRVGDKLYARALHVRLGIQCNFPAVGSQANPFVNARVIVFQYKKTDSTPLSSEMFLHGAGQGTANSFSARNIDFMSKYVILYDKVVQVRGWINTPGGAFAGVPVPDNYMRYMRFRVPLKYADKQLKYQAQSTNCNNGLWLLVLSDQPTINNNPTYTFDSNFTYTDL